MKLLMCQHYVKSCASTELPDPQLPRKLVLSLLPLGPGSVCCPRLHIKKLCPDSIPREFKL